jgi:D-aminoacyl-tRNA deacylase
VILVALADAVAGAQALRSNGSRVGRHRFTPAADSKRQRGTRPDFSGAAPKQQAGPLYERFCAALRQLDVHVETGVFGARMQLELVNDGPVTIILET